MKLGKKLKLFLKEIKIGFSTEQNHETVISEVKGVHHVKETVSAKERVNLVSLSVADEETDMLRLTNVVYGTENVDSRWHLKEVSEEHFKLLKMLAVLPPEDQYKLVMSLEENLKHAEPSIIIKENGYSLRLFAHAAYPLLKFEDVPLEEYAIPKKAHKLSWWLKHSNII